MSSGSTDISRGIVSAQFATLPLLLRRGAGEHPDRDLLVYERPDGSEATLSWREVLERAGAIATRLRRAGIAPHDRVHLHLPNRPEFLLVWFGAALLGASIVPTNTAASAEELAYMISHSRARLSVTDLEGEPTVESAIAQLRSRMPIWCCERDDLWEGAPGSVAQDPPPSSELAILYTSGTTARPKGVIVTQANYAFAGETVAKALAVTPQDRLMIALPLFHANAQCYSTMAALHAGATLVLVPRFSASRFVDQCRHHRVTVASLFSAPIRMILARLPVATARDHHLRVVLFAQNLLDEEVAGWNRRVGAPLIQLYGMTETGGPPLMNPLRGSRDPHSMGQVSLGYTCRVVGDDGEDVPLETVGQLLVGGIPGVTLAAGYLDDPPATAAAFREGWLHTGDLVRVSRTGHMYFVGRGKEMIKRGGENIAPGEIETVIRAHPAVRDAAVIGVPDPVFEEKVIAFVVADGTVTESDLRSWCAERVAKFRIPERILFEAELPRTSVGKVQKRVLTDSWAERARLESA